MSVVAPAGNGTMIRTFLAGNRSWPRTAAGTSAIVPAATVDPTNSRRVPAWIGSDFLLSSRMALSSLDRIACRLNAAASVVLRSSFTAWLLHANVVHGCEQAVGRFEQVVELPTACCPPAHRETAHYHRSNRGLACAHRRRRLRPPSSRDSRSRS